MRPSHHIDITIGIPNANCFQDEADVVRSASPDRIYESAWIISGPRLVQIREALSKAVYVILRTQCHDVFGPRSAPPLDFAKLPGLFTRQGCCSGEAAAYEIVAIYIEWAATKPM